jgi:hypothetical protein
MLRDYFVIPKGGASDEWNRPCYRMASGFFIYPSLARLGASRLAMFQDYFVIPEGGVQNFQACTLRDALFNFAERADYYMIPEKGRFKIFKPAHCVMRFFIFLAHSNPSLTLRIWIAGK